LATIWVVAKLPSIIWVPADRISVPPRQSERRVRSCAKTQRHSDILWSLDYGNLKIMHLVSISWRQSIFFVPLHLAKVLQLWSAQHRI
jgi:hypothetical protein